MGATDAPHRFDYDYDYDYDLSGWLPILTYRAVPIHIQLSKQDGASPMIIVTPVGATESVRSERIFQSHIKDAAGVLLTNVNVPNSAASGAFTREVDGVAITPSGIFTVEVKGLRARGTLQPSRMDAWTVVDGDLSVPMMGRPHAQALTHSKYLASFLKDAGVVSGWVQAVLVIVGDGIVLPDAVETLTFDNVHVVVSRPGVGEVLNEQVISPVVGQQEISVEAAQALLGVFECTTSGPTLADLLGEGFRTEQVIGEELEIKRQQARAEFLACAPAVSETTAAGSDESADISVLDAPSVSEWRATAERFEQVTAVDAELTEVGAFVDGVALHRRLVSYAARKDVDLSIVASVVISPEEVWGDESDSNRVFCGHGYAVSVRTLDGLALYFKEYAIAHAEINGVTVDGVEITARAAKAALGHMDLSLEAVARVVSMPQERWWIPGTTDVAHARGDIVAVTSGPNGPVLYVQSRALAVARSVPKPIPEEPKVTDMLAGEFTLRASAVNWCHRRRVDVAEIAAVILKPAHVWAGHSENMEVRCGEAHAVLVDTESSEVVAVMTAAEAVEYRDGIVRDGVRLSGRCLFLVRRRKRPVEDLVAAVNRPELVARAAGAVESVYVGTTVAVMVCDTSGAILDFTYADHARARVARGELMRVDGFDSATETTMQAPVGSATGTQAVVPSITSKPSPAMFAAMAGATAPVEADRELTSEEALVGEVVELAPVPVVLPSPRAVQGPSPLLIPARRR